MNLLSIDVGIKNLAYCLLYVNERKYSIKKWGIIDLCENKKFKCLEKTKKGECCNNNAIYTKNGVNYCKTHGKKTEYKIPPNKINKLKLADLIKLAPNYDIDLPKKILKTEIISLIQEKCLDPIIDKKVETFNLVDLGKSMEKQLNTVFNDIQIDHIIIENQITPIANKMKTIQGMIMQSFIIKGIENIKFISACNKLKFFATADDNGSKKNYDKRKTAGTVITQKLIGCDNLGDNWLVYFNNHYKKDDLADSMLQGLWYLIYNNYINNNADYLKL